jgi:phosphoribosylamine--glycine ligase
MVICDGEHAVALPPAQDFKRLGDGGAGPNTGGMGAFAPLATMSDPLVEHVMTNTIEPTLRELRRRGVDYRGVLYAGLMLTPSGPKLLEYNVRFGDPETQALIPLILDDLDEFLISAASGRMRARPQLHHGGAVTVVLAAAGYPQRPRSGDVIHGLASDGQLADPIPGVTVFHAGTRIDDAGAFVTAGGRVLAITATGESVDDARARAYGAAATVSFDGCQMRSDIASSHR